MAQIIPEQEHEQEDWAYGPVRQMAIAKGSGDYYYAPTDRFYCVASNGEEAIVLGWYGAEFKRNHPAEALQYSMDMWREFLNVPVLEPA